MTVKYKVHELAKDFDISSKEILSILSQGSGDEKKSQTVLDEGQINIVFEVLTKQHEVKSFDDYFKMGEQARLEKKNKKAAAKKARDDQQAKIALELARLAAAAKGENIAEDKKQEPKKEKQVTAKPEEKKQEKPVKKEEPQKQQKADVKPQEKKEEKPVKKVEPQKQEKTEDKKVEHKVSTPIPPRKPKVAGEAPNRGPAEMRHVDTRTSNVEVERYNDKYFNIAADRGYDDVKGGKQLIKKRNNQQQRYGSKKSKQETEADKLRKIQLERIKKTPIEVTVGDTITVADLAAKMKKTAAEVIKELMKLGVMAAQTQEIDYDTAEIVATEMGAKVKREVVVTIEERIMDDTEDTLENLLPRDPVVCVMGHVDHGKTSLLDAIRDKNVVDTEAGGITQAIGAYRVNIGGRNITFLDTPGHEAFTAMRERGAKSTDIAILVVAADDGIMPQTIEAINHAKMAKVQIIVAINKMDKQGANPDRIMQQLTEHELVPEIWGGDIITVPVSAKNKTGIDELLENVLLVADVMELKANPNRRAGGLVIEARLDKGRGPVATLLVQKGTLHTGDIIVAGTSVGRVRAMLNENGMKMTEAGPSVPVEITGLDAVPSAGDTFDAVSDERLARELVEQRIQKAKEDVWGANQKVTLDNLFSHMQEGDMKEFNIIVKADVQGSVEAVKQSLEKLSNAEVKVRVIHGAVGAVNESDVMLANTSNAIIVGFNVRPESGAKANAERDGVEIRLYRVIYHAIEEIESAMKGMLAPKFRDVEKGSAEVRQIYKISSVGTIAGSYVTNGTITRNCKIRVVRDGIVIAEDEIDSLRRFKDDVKEVNTGYECGIGLVKFNDIKEGDILEGFITEEYRED